MNGFVKAGVAASLVAISALAPTGAVAADLGDGWRGGSVKDGYVPTATHRTAGPCYLRGDVGYSVSTNADISWYSATTDADEVTGVSSGNKWMGEVGIGCGSGSRGWRGEVMFGYRGKFHSEGEPQLWIPDPLVPVPTNDPIHVSISSYTAMANLYYDFGNFRGFSPYVGAGIGGAYNVMDGVYFTENPLLVNTIAGDDKLAFAWQVMAGVGYQVSERVVLDFGYRYVDLGTAQSGRVDNAGFVNPRVEVDDLTAHEFKVGLRFHLGGAASHVVGEPMK